MENDRGDQGGVSAATVINFLIGTVAMLGNGLVCLVMTAKRQHFSSATNRLILHQSIMDFLSGLLFIIFLYVPTVQEVDLPPNILGELMCRMRRPDYIQWSLFIGSTYNLVLISLERYIATCHPIKYRNHFSLTKLKVVMVFPWIAGFVINSNPLFFNQLDYETLQCRFQSNIGLIQKVIAPLQTTFDYIVPVLIHIFAYTKMWLMIRSRMTDQTNPVDGRMNRAKRNVLVILFMTAVCFIICWGPIESFYLYNNLTGNLSNFTLIYPIVAGITAVNTCVNPFIYCFMYEHFRFHLKKMIMDLVRRNRVEAVQVGNGSTAVDEEISNCA